MIERLLEEISFNATDLATEKKEEVLTLTADDVERYLGMLVKDEDLSRFIL